MIPKTIHYCWFGRNPKPKLAEKCIASWRKYCPDYEIIEWNEDNFDVNMNGYTRMCYEQKKYAFLSDYARLLVVAEHGGVYFDTDVELVKPIDPLMELPAFYSFETTEYVATGLGFGSVAQGNTSIILQGILTGQRRHAVCIMLALELIPHGQYDNTNQRRHQNPRHAKFLPTMQLSVCRKSCK